MTPAQKKLRELRERQSRARQRMAELGLADSLTAETRSELDTIERDTPDLERQIRAATVAVEQEEGEQRQAAATTEPDAEMRERRDLRGKARLEGYLRARMEGRLPSGAEAELAAAAGVVEGSIPIELWDVLNPAEHRADAATPAPSTVGVNLEPIQPQLFASSIAVRLGIDMPRVESGTFATGTITGGLTALPRARGEAIESSAATFAMQNTGPHRVSARLSTRLEDVAAVGAANFESQLRETMATKLTDALDNQAINGDGTGDNLHGILSRLTDPSDPSDVADFDRFLAAFAGGVDGLWASRLKEVAIVAGVETYQLASRAFRDAGDGNKRGDVSFSTYAEEHLGGWWTNSRMPGLSNTGNLQQAILYRMGMMGVSTAVCPHWGRIEIDDIYSGSASAERHFTAHVILGDVILRQPAAYSQVAFKTA